MPSKHLGGKWKPQSPILGSFQGGSTCFACRAVPCANTVLQSTSKSQCSAGFLQKRSRGQNNLLQISTWALQPQSRKCEWCTCGYVSTVVLVGCQNEDMLLWQCQLDALGYLSSSGRQHNEIQNTNCFKITLDVPKLLPEWFEKKGSTELAFLGNE